MLNNNVYNEVLRLISMGLQNINLMGSSCFSIKGSIKKGHLGYKMQVQTKNIENNDNQPQFKQFMESLQSMVEYPFYQPTWKDMRVVTPKENIKVNYLLAKMHNDTSMIRESDFIACLPMRSYLYGAIANKKLFQESKTERQDKFKNIVEINNKIWLKVPLLEAQLFAHQLRQRIQISPAHCYLMLERECTSFEVSEDIASPFNLFPAIFLIQNSNLTVLRQKQKIKKLVEETSGYQRISLQKNCLINGVLLRNEKQLKQGSQQKIGNSNDIWIKEILNQKELSLQKSDKLICYINPLARERMLGTKVPAFSKFSTYFELKSLFQQEHVDLQALFDPNLILKAQKCELMSIYILIFSIKYVMYNNPNDLQIPMLFLQNFVDLRSKQNKIMSSVIGVMKFFYLIGANKQIATNETIQLAQNCCKNILQISSVNSHLLVDAYFIQFGIEVDQKITPIRQNPLWVPDQKIKQRFFIHQKPNFVLVNSLKSLWLQKQEQILKEILNLSPNKQNKSESFLNIEFEQWQNDCIQIWNKLYCSSPFIDFNSLTAHKNQALSINQIIFAEYLISIKILKFSLQLFLLENTFIKISNKMETIGLTKKWFQIVDIFTSNPVFSFCSGELAITILTFDSLLKLHEDSNHQGVQHSLNKAIDIWFRIYKDPKSKFSSYIPNQWILFVIKIILDFNARKQPNSKSQNIFPLHNILDCFFVDHGLSQYGQPTSLKSVLMNFPTRNISGIYYQRQQLLAPTTCDQNQLPFLKTGSSLIDSPFSDLSSKSNYSQSVSNTESAFPKRKRKNKNKLFDTYRLSDNRSFRSGVFIWGKNINSVPLLYAFAKNLDVFKVSCSSYHVVIATTVGIFGWGENGSGQLGDPSEKQNIKGIKQVFSCSIISPQNIELSCGNEHTAILIKNEPLIMFGQTEGGIISGSGHKFDNISCGGLHTLGIKNGLVYSWGRGEGGQLGHKPVELNKKVREQSTDFFLDSPKLIPNLPLIKKSVCGDAHSVLLSVEGDVYVFGFSYQGQLGLGLTGESQVFQVFQPTKLVFKKDSIKVEDIFAGSTFTFFKTLNGQIYSCGLNDCNQLGSERTLKVFQKKKYLGQQKKGNQRKTGQLEFSRPNNLEIFNGEIRVDKIYCGENHCLANAVYMNKENMIMGWGLNKQFQLSCQFVPENITPRTIDLLHDFNFFDFACGSNYSLGLVVNKNQLSLRDLENRIEQLCKEALTLNLKF